MELDTAQSTPEKQVYRCNGCQREVVIAFNVVSAGS